MPNNFFQFKQFIVFQEHCAMKVTTDACLFGAWVAKELNNRDSRDRKQTINTEGDINVYASNHLLDIGCGTGLLSLMVAQKNQQLLIDAVELDHDAAQQATSNFAGSPWPGQLTVIEGDVRNVAFEKKYNVMISNPPFYQNDLSTPDVKKKLAHHDAGLLLDQLPGIISRQLTSDGIFFLLLPYRRTSEIEDLLKTQGLHCSKKLFVRATPEHPFSRVMLSGSILAGEPAIVQEISIRTNDNQYTNEFNALLGDYYLNG